MALDAERASRRGQGTRTWDRLADTRVFRRRGRGSEVFEVPGQGTPGSRTVNPSPIGDEPMTIEVLAAA